MVTLYGTVTADDIYRAVTEKQFDVLHFATHGGPEGVQLSGGVVLPPDDIAQFVRLRESVGVFFSACQTGRLAAYCTNHGARWAISAEVDLLNVDAWKMAAAFYSHQRNGHSKDFVGAYRLADSGDGDYSLQVSAEWLQLLMQQAALAATIPHTARPLTRQEGALWAAGLVVGLAGWAWALFALAGRF